jgi:GT2 family glycosyltransferase
MSVSVVIPTKDRLNSLRHVLPSYLSQPEVAEIIVVVDGSADGTAEYVQSLASTTCKVRCIDNVVNRGIPYSKNAGVDLARFTHVFTGEDDVEVTEGFFCTLLEHMNSSGADVICARNIWRLEGESSAAAVARTDAMSGPAVNLRTIMIETSLRLADDTPQLLLAGPMLAPVEVFRHVRYDERYKVNFWREESDFQLSAQELGYKLVSCPHAICFNYIFENDRGGVHARVGWRRLLWVSINNWRFLKKHQDFILRNFAVTGPIRFAFLTTVRVFRDEMLYPFLVVAKRRLRRTLRLAPSLRTR